MSGGSTSHQPPASELASASGLLTLTSFYSKHPEKLTFLIAILRRPFDYNDLGAAQCCPGQLLRVPAFPSAILCHKIPDLMIFEGPDIFFDGIRALSRQDLLPGKSGVEADPDALL